MILIAYEAYVTRLKGVEKHSNADRLQKAKCFGNQVIIDLSYHENDLGVYFPVDGKLGVEFAEANNLLRKKDENGNNIGGFIDPDKRNIKAIRLRGEQSDGLFLHLESLSNFTDITQLKEGDTVTVLNGITICEKYIPAQNPKTRRTKGPVKSKNNLKFKFPYFEQHIDTEQLMYNLNNFHEGDLCTITLKMHGTSARTSYTIYEETQKKTLMQRLLRKPPKMIREWKNVSGSRRVTLNFEEFNSDGYYGNNEFRKKWHDEIAPKLHKGEEIYYEIVGYVDENTLIMPEGNNKKLNDKEFIKQYGDTTRFNYNCEPGECMAYVYRMTKTDEDGYVIEYPDWYMRTRCEQLGLNCVPKLDEFIYTTQEDLLKRVEKYVGGADPIGKTHIREGVVVRIQNRNKFKAYKHKNFEFKMLEGLIKETASVPDIEEAEEEVVLENK